MTTFNHCRFCKDWRDQNMIRYAPRHYAHPKCWLDRKPLAALPWHQIARLPFFMLKDRGLLDEAEQLIKVKNHPKTRLQKRIDAILAARTQ